MNLLPRKYLTGLSGLKMATEAITNIPVFTEGFTT